VRYSFKWDPQKAKDNQRKHGVGFERATTVFRDPHAISIYDTEHSQNEDRWITLGLDREGAVLVVIHTFHAIDQENIRIRIISTRKATRREQRQYKEGDHETRI